MNQRTTKEFLEDVQPGITVEVTDFEKTIPDRGPYGIFPGIELHCYQCGGIRHFDAKPSSLGITHKRPPFDVFVEYRCRNCRESVKTFAIASRYSESPGKWHLTKYGEIPGFGPPIPSRIYKLVGGERDQFLRGWRCELQGLGVGAFVYYRRVVESQKNRMLDEIIRVTERLSGDEALLTELRTARGETQFTKAIEAVKHALPQSLLVNGHNPLRLLHIALSSGVHELDDSTCLELATSIRVVLVELAERLALALKDEAELSAALQRLADRSRN